MAGEGGGYEIEGEGGGGTDKKSVWIKGGY